ncbi:MAG: hypothetical protein D4R79_00215 [Comamonadaceae bacterium]|nr:hypothetical protein [Rhodoferax sp.]TSA15737.1 MAG: hypothetical protein D4R79_00215 [Comamonadaceae bacterium]
MAIHTTFLGATKISGEDAKVFSRKIAHSRGTVAAANGAINGRRMLNTFSKKGVVTIKLNIKPASKVVA